MKKMKFNLVRLSALAAMGAVFMSADDCGGTTTDTAGSADLAALHQKIQDLETKCNTLESGQTTMNTTLGGKLDSDPTLRPFSLTKQEREAIKAFQKDAVVLDSSDNHYYKWDGTNWIKLHNYLPVQIPQRSPKLEIGAAVPTDNSPYIKGDLFLVISTNAFHEFDGTAWSPKHTVGVGALGALTAAQLGHLATLGGSGANFAHLATLGGSGANFAHLATLGGSGANFAHLATLGGSGANFAHLAALGSTAGLNHLATLGGSGANFGHLAALGNCGANFGHLAALGNCGANFANLAALGAAIPALAGGGADADKVLKVNAAGNAFEFGPTFVAADKADLDTLRTITGGAAGNLAGGVGVLNSFLYGGGAVLTAAKAQSLSLFGSALADDATGTAIGGLTGLKVAAIDGDFVTNIGHLGTMVGAGLQGITAAQLGLLTGLAGLATGGLAANHFIKLDGFGNAFVSAA